MKQYVKPFRPIYPSPAALITSVGQDGAPNIITLGEVFNVSVCKPVIVGISIARQRYSHSLISASREFVVNLATTSLAEKVDQCGSVSGRNIDKFSAFSLTPLPASQVKPPLIAECPVNVECKVLSIQEVGDHDLFLGEAIAEHVDEDILDEAGRIQVNKLDALCYSHMEYWSYGKVIGRKGFSKKN